MWSMMSRHLTYYSIFPTFAYYSMLYLTKASIAHKFTELIYTKVYAVVHCTKKIFTQLIIQVNKKFRKFERKYRDCIKRNGDKIGTQTCYDIST